MHYNTGGEGAFVSYFGRVSVGTPRTQDLGVSRRSDTIFVQGTTLEPSTSHIGQGVALDAETAALVYI
jgi:hypothetical protein